MAKAKYDFTDSNVLAKLEEYARDGLNDKQIAECFGYNETYFCELKGKITELSKALKKGRAPLNYHVENILFKKCIGYKQVVRKPFKVKEKYYDSKGRLCEKEKVEVVDVEETVFPDVTAQIFWLKNRKPKQWNRKDGDDDEANKTPTPDELDHGIDIKSWINAEIKYKNDKKE